MPLGELVTVPDPVPALVTVRVFVLAVKVAVTDLAALMVTTQVAVPEQPSPVQPVKVEPVEATAVRVTTVLLLKLAEQVDPQLMPLGELVTVPDPVPALVTSSGYVVRLFQVNKTSTQ